MICTRDQGGNETGVRREAQGARRIIRLRTQFAHAEFADDVFSRNSKPFCNERVQFRLWQRAGTVFVAAGFHDARTGGKLDPQVSLHQIIQQMHKGESGAQNQLRIVDCGLRIIAQRRKGGIGIQSPGAIRRQLAEKFCVTRGDACLTYFPPDGFKHVDERRMGRERGRRRQNGQFEI